MSGRERNGGGRGRVVYFKFFQTLGRTRRERKKASVAKGRWGVGSWSVMRGSGKEEKKGKKRKERSATGREGGGIVVEIEERERGRKEEGRLDPAPPSNH